MKPTSLLILATSVLLVACAGGDVSNPAAVSKLPPMPQPPDNPATPAKVALGKQLFADPRHPYTQALLASVPVADPKQKNLTPMIDGDVPSPINPPSGCAFHTRCRYVMDRCKVERPVLAEAGTRHQVACWLNDGTGRPE